MNKGITVENLLFMLPEMLQNDENIKSIATVIANEAEAYDGQAGILRIYAAIDSLPEKLLDILAKDFKIDWWDADQTLDAKREMFKHSFYVHRHAGTKDAVMTAVSAIYTDTWLQEWFDYDGKPYHFKLIIDAEYQGISPQKHQRVLDRVAYFKNRRSVLDGIEYIGGNTTAETYAGAAMAGMQITQTATALNS